ncbi:MAG: hypothetical protein HJJLKODD_00936 [Phycisphaerae bacterium]|nr:hypothetical protein [Phycisphaerae bacterium]
MSSIGAGSIAGTNAALTAHYLQGTQRDLQAAGQQLTRQSAKTPQSSTDSRQPIYGAGSEFALVVTEYADQADQLQKDFEKRRQERQAELEQQARELAKAEAASRFKQPDAPDAKESDAAQDDESAEQSILKSLSGPEASQASESKSALKQLDPQAKAPSSRSLSALAEEPESMLRFGHLDVVA